MSFKSQLLKEAERRINKTSQQPRSEDDVKSTLFSEANAKIQKLRRVAALKKDAMSYHQGQKEFINSNVTWSKVDLTPNMEAVEAQLIAAFKPYFYALINGRKSEITPPPLVLRYEATRDLFPVVDENYPETAESYQDAVNAVQVINQVVNGFDQFVKAVENAPFAMLMYFHSSDRQEKDGGFNDSQLTRFLQSEHARLQRQPLTYGGKPISQGYYSEHARQDQVHKTQSSSAFRRYDLADINRETSKSKLSKWISWAHQNGFQINYQAIASEIQKLEQDTIAKHKLSEGKLTPQQSEWRRSIMHYYTGIDPNDPKKLPAASSLAGRITKAIRYGCGPLGRKPTKKDRQKHWGYDPDRGEYMRGLPTETEMETNKVTEAACPYLDITELRLIAKHMTGEHPMVPPGTYLIPDETTYYNANGLDSRPDDPEKSMLVIPSLKRLPSTGQFVYDKDQGNLMGNHLRKYGVVLQEFMRKWGPWAEEALKVLKSPKARSLLATYYNNNLENNQVDAAVPYDAWDVVMNQRTNAESVLELIGKHNDYKSLYNNVLNKSLASAITNFNYYAGNGAKTSEGKDVTYEPQGSFQFVNSEAKLSGSIEKITQSLQQWIQEFNQAYQQQTNALQGKENTIQRNAIKKYARQDVHEMAYNITSLHTQGAIDWDQYSFLISLLGDIVDQNGTPLVRNLKSVTPTDQEQMLRPQDFNVFKKYGYPVAKLLDFLSGVMVRSCNDHANNRINMRNGETIDEEHFGSNYSAGSGKAGSTKLMLGIRYAFRSGELGSDDQELLKTMRYERGKRKLKVPQQGVDITPQTAHPQKGSPVPQAFQQGAGKILENITYWVGQASSTRNFHKGLDEGDAGLLLQNKSWRQTIDYIERHYPQMISQLGLTFDPINIDLKRLQEATKRAILAVTETMDVDAIFEDQEGNKILISPDEVQEDIAIAEDFKAAARTNNISILDAPEDEEVIEMPPGVLEEVRENPPEALQEPDVKPDTQPKVEDSQLIETINGLIEELDGIAENEGNEEAAEKIQTIDIAVRNGTLKPQKALDQLNKIKSELVVNPQQEQDEIEHNLMMFWEDRLANNKMNITDMGRLESVLDRIVNYTVRTGTPLPPNLAAYIEESKTVNQQFGPGAKPDATYNPELDEDNYMPMKNMTRAMVVDPGGYVGKRKKTKSLVRNRPDPNTGKLKKSEVINTLIKLCDRLDDTGEYVLSDKITLLIKKMTEE